MTTQPLIDLGGEPHNPPLHLALANGFVAQTYIPLLRHLSDRYHMVCLPPRALWDEAAQPPQLDADGPDWRQLADDLLTGFAHYELDKLVAVGHSFGAVATMLAALREPQQFKALVFLDPTLLDPAILDVLRQAQAAGRADEHPLAKIAIRRSNEFESVQAAYQRFRSKKVFAQWPDETVQLYAEHGTRPSAEGRQLAWSPEWEAFYYSSMHTEIWDDVAKLNDLDIPMLFINGSDSDTFIEASVERVRRLVPRATHQTIVGHGHLFPQSAPDEAGRMICEWLQATLDDSEG